MEEWELEVRRARRGDGAAMERLLRRVGGRLFGLAFQLLRDPREAEDVTQEALLRIYDKLPALREPARFLSWSAAIAANLCRDRIRTRKPSVGLDEARAMPARDDPAGEAAAGETWQHLMQAVGQLSEPLRLALLLRDVQGLSYEEVGAALDLPLGTVKSRLFEARRRLREAITREGELVRHDL